MLITCDGGDLKLYLEKMRMFKNLSKRIHLDKKLLNKKVKIELSTVILLLKLVLKHVDAKT